MAENSEAHRLPDISKLKPENANRGSFLKRVGAAVLTGVGFAGLTTANEATAADPGPVPKPGEQKPLPLPQRFAEPVIDPRPGPIELNPAPDTSKSVPIQQESEFKADIKIPQEFKAPIEKATARAGNFLDNEEIKVQFTPPGKVTSVEARYSPRDSEKINPYLFVRFSEKDGQPWELTNLQAGEKLSEIIRESKGVQLTYKFIDAFRKHIGIDLRKVDAGEVPQAQLDIFNKISKYFDFAMYVDQISGSDDLGSPKTTAELLFDKALSIWMLEPKRLAKIIKTAPESIKESLANIFGSTLHLAIDSSPKKARWDSFGLDNNSIYSVVESGKNAQLKKYFDENIAARK